MIIIIPIWKITTIPLFSVPGQAMASEYFGPHKKTQLSASKIDNRKQDTKAEMTKIIHIIVCRDYFIRTE